ncbi:MAG: T9SS type A sorting domain-containing protein [Bacteroidia bacterium]
MKYLFTSIVTLLFASLTFGQSCPSNDSAVMGPGSGNDVFYSLKQATSTGSGVVKTVANNTWHMAISVQASNFPSNPANGVNIRINSTNGENPQAGQSGWKLVKLNGEDPNNWRNIDTTGMYALPELLDSDSTWNLGAFTKGYSGSNPFNFIWGTYNQSNHNVESNGNVYVLFNESAGDYKKIHVKEVTYDTMWHIIMSNIDNSDSVYLNINKKAYPKRLFVYYNVLTNQVLDREPDSDKWDLLWTKYKGIIDFQGSKVPYGVTGVLHNNGVKVAQNLGKKCDEVWLRTKTAMDENNISTIGHDWKTFNGSAYDITDTFVYFITTSDTVTYKMTMKSYQGGGMGKTEFNLYEATLSLDENTISSLLNMYPNPVQNMLNINSETEILEVLIYDMQGKLVLESGKSNTIDVNSLNKGVYVVTVRTSEGVAHQTIIKE